MTSLGLIIIAVAWLIQFMLMSKKDRSLQNLFIFIYTLGTLVLIFDAFNSRMTEVATANLAIAGVATAVFYKQNHK